MKIFEENGNIRLQLMDLVRGKMLFDFIVSKGVFNELRDHIISNLEEFENE